MKRLIKLFLLITTSFLIASTNIFPQQTRTALFPYKICVADDNNFPVVNAAIKLQIYDRIKSMSIDAKLVLDRIIRTNEKGIITGFAILRETKNFNDYEMDINYVVEKEGFCKIEGYSGTYRIGKSNPDTCFISVSLKKTSPLVHELNVKVLDQKGNPVELARVDLTASLGIFNKVESTLQTDLSGKFYQKFIYGETIDECSEKIKNETATTVFFTINKTGFYQKKEMSTISTKGNTTYTVILNQPSDYFDDKFLSIRKFKKLKENTFSFLNSILLESYLRDCSLDYNSITVENFKKKNYLRLSFSDLTTYNSIKLNKYDIAKRVFDEIIRKLLNPLNENLRNSKEIDGYSVVIRSQSKNFVDNNSSKEGLIYKFYLLKTTVASYKDKDITGQQLVDRSIILLNDERIDLKFQ